MLLISVVLLGALALLLVAGLWIALTLLGVGWIAMTLFTDSPAGSLMATTIWGASTSWALTALPLFIWMGEILFRTRISEDMFRGLAPWMAPLPGRLMHCNVAGCGIFAAISGSSAATAATIGRITIPELLKRGYDETMTVGSLAGAGTLGLLIPPSIIMIVYGVAADVSIARLFVAGVLPGVMLMLLFSGYIVAWALQKAERAGAGERADRHRLVVTALEQLGDGDAADRGSGGGRRARDRCENAAAEDVAVHQPARQRRHPRREAAKHVLRNPGAKQDLAHPDEERQRGERPAGARSPDRGCHQAAGRRIGEKSHRDPADAKQGERDPKTGNQQQRQSADENDRDQPHFRASAAS